MDWNRRNKNHWKDRLDKEQRLGWKRKKKTGIKKENLNFFQ